MGRWGRSLISGSPPAKRADKRPGSDAIDFEGAALQSRLFPAIRGRPLRVLFYMRIDRVIHHPERVELTIQHPYLLFQVRALQQRRI